MGFSIKLPPPIRISPPKPIHINLPPPPKPIHINLPPPIRIPPPKPIHINIPPPIRIPPIKLPPPIHINLPPPIHVPPIKLPPPIHINLPPPLHINIPPPIRIAPIHLPPPLVIPKPEINMKALKESLGIIAGVISVNPVGKLLVMGVMGIADVATKGEASNFINDGHKMNGTLSMLPGGMLVQQIANDASNGKSGDALTKYVPDPKKMIIRDIITVGEAGIKNPSNTLNATKSVVVQNIDTIKNSTVVVQTSNVVKPTLSNVISISTAPPPVITSTLNIIHSIPVVPVIKPTLSIVAPIIHSIPVPDVIKTIISTILPPPPPPPPAPPVVISSTLSPVVVISIPPVIPTTLSVSVPPVIVPVVPVVPLLAPATTLQPVSHTTDYIVPVIALGTILTTLMFL